MADVHLGALTTRRGGIPAHVGLVGLVAFAAAVVSLPAGAAWPFVAVGAMALARLVAVGAPAGWVLPRLAVEVPFLVFALTLAFVAEGPRLPLGPVSVSAPGVVAGGVMLAKSGICVLAALAYARTTTPEGLVAGLTRLRVPEVIVQIASFMARYVGVVADGRIVQKEIRGNPGYRTFLQNKTPKNAEENRIII